MLSSPSLGLVISHGLAIVFGNDIAIYYILTLNVLLENT